MDNNFMDNHVMPKKSIFHEEPFSTQETQENEGGMVERLQGAVSKTSNVLFISK